MLRAAVAGAGLAALAANGLASGAAARGDAGAERVRRDRDSTAQPIRGSGPRIGLQLYQLLELAQKDFAGTIATVASLGFRRVEMFPAFGPAREVAATLAKHGIEAPSLTVTPRPLVPGIPDLTDGLDALVDYAKAVGAHTLTCSFPWLPAERYAGRSPFEALPGLMQAMTPADWSVYAGFLNRAGERLKRAGLRIGTHNHVAEFAGTGGARGFDVVAAATDPSLVSLELDCGWAIVGGADPVELMRRYRGRIRMLHLKDLARGREPGLGLKTPTVPLGDGEVDFRGILAAAAETGVDYAFVEQEPPFTPSPIEAAKRSLAHLASIGAAL